MSMKKRWDARHPDVPIKAETPRGVWNELKRNMGDVCDTERCWLRQHFMKGHVDGVLRNFTFAPTAPASWKKKPDEWLTSLDIDKVMKQWERKHKEFEFIGPSPIDFDERVAEGECVWTELCKFDLARSLKRGKKKIGIIFNLDPHYKSGSHWVAMYVDVARRVVFYFDSNGDAVPARVKALAQRIINQGKELNMDIKFIQNHPVEHQRGDTECGIYTLYLITQLLTGKKTYKSFMEERIPDEKMLALRKQYFNED
tara:strand:+ start:2693 stop:3460 length:768 start_codon:yes stop_codon:yes gene_type:complete